MARTERERKRQATREQGKARHATLHYDLTQQTWVDDGDPFLVAEMTSVLNPQSWQVLLPPLRRQFLLDRGIHLIAFHCEACGQHGEGNLHDVLGQVFEELFIGFEADAEFDRHTLSKKPGKGSLRVECLLSRESVVESQSSEQVSAVEGGGTTEVSIGGAASSLDSPLVESADALTLDNESEAGQDGKVPSPEEKITELFAGLPDNSEERREAVVHLLTTVAREGINCLGRVEFPAEPSSISGASERPVVSLPVAEEKVKTVLILSHAFHEEMKDAVRQAITTLLQNPPETFLAKQNLAALVNQILDDLRVAIRDPATGSACSVVAVQGRETDEKGYLYLRPRTTASRTKKRPIPVTEVGEIELTELSSSATLALPKTGRS